MIEPGTPLEIEHQGQKFTSSVLSRRQQRQLTQLVQSVSSLESNVAAIDRLYELLDEIVKVCLPGIGEADADRLGVDDVIAIANEVLVKHMLGFDAKKKSEPPQSLGPACSVEVVEGGVWTDTTGFA